ncbi:universal stress protein [Cellulomonas composti]|uniref:Universal stress protein n=1 Tax=Cellulomonas composti TaxID=266130 RepID=A0A511J8F3_9CELL|nr:universal stress protein [Cellulomonas composti]GEL93999.1 universal stress protein [Cellulomonas composti]
MRRIIVGIERSAHSGAALDWAARRCEHPTARLVVVHCTGYTLTEFDLPNNLLDPDAADLLANAEARARELVPGLEVETRLDRRRPAQALVELAGPDDLLVVGTHRLSPAERAFAGSLAYQVAAHAPCPVAVVPGPPRADATGIVVGVDDSSYSVAALDVAASLCEWTGHDLHVVHALSDASVYAGRESFPTEVVATYHQSQRLILSEVMAGLAERHPDVRVHADLSNERPAKALLTAASSAWLLVVGSRGRHGLPRLLLGSTSHTVVLNARCPVLVVRAREGAQ